MLGDGETQVERMFKKAAVAWLQIDLMSALVFGKTDISSVVSADIWIQGLPDIGCLLVECR